MMAYAEFLLLHRRELERISGLGHCVANSTRRKLEH